MDLESLISHLENQLNYKSKRINDWITLKSRYQNFKRESIQGLLSIETTNRQRNKLRKDILSFIGSLTPEDYSIEMQLSRFSSWTEKYEIANRIIHQIRKEKIDFSKVKSRQQIKRIEKENGISDPREIQITVFNSKKKIVYHKTKRKGSLAFHRDIFAKNIFEKPAKFDFGIIAWVDRSSQDLNISHRENEGIFFTHDTYTVVIELHKEIHYLGQRYI